MKCEYRILDKDCGHETNVYFNGRNLCWEHYDVIRDIIEAFPDPTIGAEVGKIFNIKPKFIDKPTACCAGCGEMLYCNEEYIMDGGPQISGLYWHKSCKDLERAMTIQDINAEIKKWA